MIKKGVILTTNLLVSKAEEASILEGATVLKDDLKNTWEGYSDRIISKSFKFTSATSLGDEKQFVIKLSDGEPVGIHTVFVIFPAYSILT